MNKAKYDEMNRVFRKDYMKTPISVDTMKFGYADSFKTCWVYVFGFRVFSFTLNGGGY